MEDASDEIDEAILPKEVRSLVPKFMHDLNYKDNKKFKKEKRRTTRPHSTSYHKSRIRTINASNDIQNVSDRPKIHEFTMKTRPLEKNRIDESSPRIQLNINGNKVFGRLGSEGLSGNTDVFFSNGAKFKGQFLNGKMLSGIFEFTNGFVYEGGFMHNKFFGQGTLRFPNGKVISGEWNGQKIMGNGEIEYPGGDIYYGEIENFRKNGFGYFFLKNERKFIGNFKDGKIYGKGSYYIDEKLVAEGNWQDGELVTAMHANQTESINQISSQNRSSSYTSILKPSRECSQELTSHSMNSRQLSQQASNLESVKIVSDDDNDGPENIFEAKSKEVGPAIKKGGKRKVGWVEL